MYPYKDALTLIKTFEGFNEKAYPDPETGSEPYTIGYGTQFYPDGSAVKQGHLCTKKKALEYVLKEINIIAHELKSLNIGIDNDMEQALISFIHSIGWESFLYSSLIDLIEREEYVGAAETMQQWIYDNQHRVIGGLVERRRKEARLFMNSVNSSAWNSTEILLKAFRNYSAAPHEVRAIRTLETNISPYVLSEFANNFDLDNDSVYREFSTEDLKTIYKCWD